jgi:hypothetical protein
VVLSAKKREVSPTLARASHQAGQRKASEVEGMKFATNRPYADPDTAAHKLIERGWLQMHESGTFVKFTEMRADLFA